jgi:putative membrane protein
MKNVLLVLSMVITSLCISCNSNNQSQDSVDSAKQENESLDSSKITSDNKDSLKDDENFMVNAASGGLLEVKLGNMAMKNAASAQVKQFGKMMVTDHTKANNELIALAKRKNIAIPSTPGNDEQDMIDKLQKQQGKDFDKDYVSMMIDDHKHDINEFQKAVDNAKDSDIKAFAVKTLPVLQKHLDKIQAIDSTMKK